MEIPFPDERELEPVAEESSLQSPRTSRQLLMEMVSLLIDVLTSIKIAFAWDYTTD